MDGRGCGPGAGRSLFWQWGHLGVENGGAQVGHHQGNGVAHQLEPDHVIGLVVEPEQGRWATTAREALADCLHQPPDGQLRHYRRDGRPTQPGGPDEVGPGHSRMGAEHVDDEVAVHVRHQLPIAAADALPRKSIFGKIHKKVLRILFLLRRCVNALRLPARLLPGTFVVPTCYRAARP